MNVDIQQLIVELCRDQHGSDRHDAYLDRQTGDILYVYDDPWSSPFTEAEEAEINKLIESDPDRYEYIPGSYYPVHRSLVEDFSRSEGRDGGPLGRSTREWIDNLDEGTRLEFYAFQERALDEMAYGFLREHGIDREEITT